MIEITELTKTYGDKKAVDNLSVNITPGKVTGFLGPNGAGKSTTMRMIMGLDRPTSGSVLIDGRPLAKDPAPMTKVGALLEANCVPSGVSGRDYLRALAATHGLGDKRADDMIELTGLTSVARKAAKAYSLGMGQRLGIAVALLGDPEIVILDEPVNGLDPEGVIWVRTLARSLAAQGRTVFISSHLMSEMALTADHLVVIGQGRLLADAPMEQFLSQASETATRVASPQVAAIVRVFAANGATATIEGDNTVVLHGTTAEEVGRAALANGWLLTELAPLKTSLEDAYLNLTDSAVEYRALALTA
jgi:ABC-2 type transport system ATP-binding protein